MDPQQLNEEEEVHIPLLNNIFVNAFPYEEDSDEDNLFGEVNESTESAKYVLAVNTETKETKASRVTKEKLICKVFDPEKLICKHQKDNENSKDRKDQCWYRQLMLLREAIFLKELRHPTIVDFKGMCLYNRFIKFSPNPEEENYNNPTIFLEYLPNKSLRTIIDNSSRHKDFDPIKRQICMIGLTASINFLHRNNIIHRNLNPKSIWLDGKYYPKLFDLSRSKKVIPFPNKPPTQLDNEAIIYQSPEILDESSEHTTSIDIFSLGRLLYYFITGYEPFQMKKDPIRKDPSHILIEKIKTNQYPIFPEDVPPELQELLKRCWRANPHDRPVAAEIYEKLKWHKEYQIVEFNKEITDYIEMIENFERNLTRNKLKITSTDSSYIDIPEVSIKSSNKIIPETIPEQINLLLNIISSNFAEFNEKTTLDLLIVMAENGSILKEDYLQKVINYVNNLSEKGNGIASQFLLNVFGKPIVDPKKIFEINFGCIKDLNIKEINVPFGVKKIGKKAFASLKKLERVKLPNSISIIEDEAFKDCCSLVTVNLPDSINSMGKAVFENCIKLRTIKLPSNLIEIPDETFRGDILLANVVLNENLKIIGIKAFYGCEALRYLEIPKNVQVFKKKAFYNCSKLKAINFHGEKPKIEKKALSWRVSQFP